MSKTKEQTNEKRTLCMINWYLCDRFRDVFADGFCDCMVWPFDVVNPVLHALTLEAIRNFDVLSNGYSSNLRRYAKSQLKADLSSLAKYLSAWNDSKRVVFSSNELPGSATVSSVEHQTINKYMAKKLQQQCTNFAATDVNLYTRLYDWNQKKVKELFSFAGKSYDAVKYRNERNLRGQQDALGVFEVTHEVAVSERDKVYCYRAYASTDQFAAPSFSTTSVSPQTLAERAGLTDEEAVSITAEANCTETASMILPEAKCMCDVDMKIEHKTDAHIWVHPLTGVLSFGIVAACGHKQTFAGTIDATFSNVCPRGIGPTCVCLGGRLKLDGLAIGQPNCSTRTQLAIGGGLSRVEGTSFGRWRRTSGEREDSVQAAPCDTGFVLAVYGVYEPCKGAMGVCLQWQTCRQ